MVLLLDESYKYLNRARQESLAFHLICSNQDILREVEKNLRAQGVIGVTDLQGRVKYLIDGRYGAQLGTRRIRELSEILLKRRSVDLDKYITRAMIIVDRLLGQFMFRQHLRGYVYLRQCLIILYIEGGLNMPMSKVLFPHVAQIYKCSASHVERNLRYLFEKLLEDESYVAALKKEGKDIPLYLKLNHMQSFRKFLFSDKNSSSIKASLALLFDEIKDVERQYELELMQQEMNEIKKNEREKGKEEPKKNRKKTEEEESQGDSKLKVADGEKEKETS